MATTNYSWALPVVGGSTDTWGATVNAAFESVDTQVKANETAASGKLAAASNLSDLNNAGTARTNLGVALGSDVQAYDAGLASIAGLTTAANKGLYTTAADTYATYTISATGRSLVGGADASAMRVTLGLGTISTAAAADYGALADANTWDEAQTFDLGAVSRGDTVMRVATGTAGNSGRVSFGTAAPGTLAVGEIYLQHAS